MKFFQRLFQLSWTTGILLLVVHLTFGRLVGSAGAYPVFAPPNIPQEATGQVELLLLLEEPAVGSFRNQLASPQADLDAAQTAQLQAQQRRVVAGQARLLAAAQAAGIELRLRQAYRYLLNGLAVSLPAGQVDRLPGLPELKGAYPDRPVSLHLSESIALIGADQVWTLLDSSGRPVTGTGMRVAVIDTGIDYTHPDLGGCFGPGCKVVDGYDFYNNDPDPRDDHGHGTHCAGIVAADGVLKGVAPGAQLVAYKVLSSTGAGATSTIIAAMERAADPDQNPATADAVDVISMSLGSPGTPEDPWVLAADAAVEQGIVLAVSAGNSGPDYGSIEVPSLARLVIAVGATDKTDQVAAFSSRGPLPGEDDWLKPDLLAPGVEILSTYLNGTYALASGTSMAAPHVAGSAALIKQLHPTWSPAQVKASLVSTAMDLGLDVHTQGGGRLQVAAASAAAALPWPASLSFGALELNQPLWSDTRLLWLENPTATTRSYSLSAETRLPGSVSASLQPTSLTLAPGQKGAVSLVFAADNPATPPDLERNQGQILIQQGSQVQRLPFAFFLPSLFSQGESLPFALQTSFAALLADLDRDGDLDALIGNTSYYNQPANTVWFNDGLGNFSDTGQRLGAAFTWDAALGDLDGDGDLDAFFANSEVEYAQADEVWLNNGLGYFSDSGQRLGYSLSRAVALGDLDGDGDLDAFVANGIGERGRAEADQIWLNDGLGHFSDSGQALGDAAGLDVALGDLDTDGDLDAFVANGDPQRVQNEPNQVWLNNGAAVFSSTGQGLGNALSQAVVLGDLDQDGDLDAFIANGGPAIADGQPDEVWWNNGEASFSDSGQRLGRQSSYGAALGDLHQDGTLDVFVAGYQGGNQVWLNDGQGQLSLSSPAFGDENGTDVSLGDLDGDGDLDALAANGLGQPNRLWLNRFSGGPALVRLAAPDGLAASSAAPGGIALAWTDNATGESAYRVERSADGNTGWVEIAHLPSNSASYTDAGVACGESFYYRVQAWRESDEVASPYSHLAQAMAGNCPGRIYLPKIQRPVSG